MENGACVCACSIEKHVNCLLKSSYVGKDTKRRIRSFSFRCCSLVLLLLLLIQLITRMPVWKVMIRNSQTFENHPNEIFPPGFRNFSALLNFHECRQTKKTVLKIEKMDKFTESCFS